MFQDHIAAFLQGFELGYQWGYQWGYQFAETVFTFIKDIFAPLFTLF